MRYTKYGTFLARLSVFVLCCMLLPLAALAEPLTYADEPGQSAPPEWFVSVGGGAMMRPEFEGSDKYKLRFLPIVNAQYRNRFFLSTSDGLGAYLVHEPTWNAGVVGKYNPGRKENASDLLHGMGDIDPGAEIGGFATFTPAPFSARLEVLQGIGDVEGLTVTGTVGHTISPMEQVQWTNTIGTTWANSRHNDTFFGVSGNQSRRSGYDAYDAGNGFKSVQFMSRTNYKFTQEVSATAFGGYKRLTGPAADSPLVKAGSKNQATVGLGLVYTFAP